MTSTPSPERLHAPQLRLPIKIAAILFALGVGTVETRAQAATITVNTAEDADLANGNCSLREAIRAVNQASQVDQCPAGNGSNDTINLPSATITIDSALAIQRSVAIRGNGFRRTFIKPTTTTSSRLFNIGDDAGTVSPSVTFTSARVSGFQGGAINVGAKSSLTMSWVRIENTGTSVGTQGGAIRNLGFANITDSEIDGSVSSRGGGIANFGSMTLQRVSIHGCKGEHGGAILNAGGNLRVYASTIYDNQVSVRGAAIDNTTSNGVKPSAYFHGVTIVNNSSDGSSCSNANDCGAITQLDGSLKLAASIVAFNKKAGGFGDGSNCTTAAGVPAITSLGFNVLGQDSLTRCVTGSTINDVVADPQLTRVNAADMGGFGFGQVFTPGNTSVALSVIPKSDPLCSTNDQRYVTRTHTFESKCAIGAIERSWALLVVGDITAITPADLALQQRLETMAFRVSVIDDNVVTTQDAANHAVVVISESVASSTMGSKLKGSATGIVVMEPYIYDDMAMTGTVAGTDFGMVANQSNLIGRSNSPLRIPGMIGGAGTLAATIGPRTYGFGRPAANADRVAALTSDASSSGVFAYPTGAPMVGGFSAPAPRVGFFAMGDAPSSLNGDGILLLVQSIAFAASAP